MNITRRDALLGATAAAAVTGLTAAPLAIKAAGVKAALGGVPGAVQGEDADAQVKALCRKWEAMYRHVNMSNVTDEERFAQVPVMDRLADRIADIPVRSLDGVVHKLKVAIHYMDDEAGRYADSTIRDLEHLAGGMQS